jgi:hypothetical protein
VLVTHGLRHAQAGDEGTKGACAGLVIGLGQSHLLQGSPREFCEPLGVPIKQEIAILIEYLKDNPAKLHLSIARLYLDAMREAFRCSH